MHDVPADEQHPLLKSHTKTFVLMSRLLRRLEKRSTHAEKVIDNVLCEHVNIGTGKQQWCLGRVMSMDGRRLWCETVLNDTWLQKRSKYDFMSVWRPPLNLSRPDKTFPNQGVIERHFLWRMDSRAKQTLKLKQDIEFEYVLGKAVALAEQVYVFICITLTSCFAIAISNHVISCVQVFITSTQVKGFPFYDKQGNVAKHLLDFNEKMLAITCVRVACKFCIGRPNSAYMYLDCMDVPGSLATVNKWEERILRMLSYDIGRELCPTFIDRVLDKFDVKLGMLEENLPPYLAFMNANKFFDACEKARSLFCLNSIDHTLLQETLAQNVYEAALKDLSLA